MFTKKIQPSGKKNLQNEFAHYLQKYCHIRNEKYVSKQ